MTNRRSFFASLAALPAAVFAVFQAKPLAGVTLSSAEISKANTLGEGPAAVPMHTAELYSAYSTFPVAVSLVHASHFYDSVGADAAAPPLSGRNANWCFGADPFDEVRLAEVLAFFRRIGFVVQDIKVERSLFEFGMANIRFAQVKDPRVPEASDTSPIPIRTSPFKNR